jgi:geranylgeranyl diphosphate synthase, type I
MADLLGFQETFELQLANYLETDIRNFAACHTEQTLSDYTQTISALSAKGKRLRPYLCALGYIAGGGQTPEQNIPYQVALEYFHTFCLVHDDIIDQAAQRRGVDSVHTAITKQLYAQPQVNTKRLVRVAEGQAMLLGDWLLARACELFSTAPVAAQQEFYAMIPEVVAGQMIDINTSLFPHASDDQVQKKMYFKTATYSFIRPFQIGLALAGVQAPERQLMSEFTKPLGLAFQIQDDYLDLAGDPQVTGKPILSDIKEGQHTLFSQLLINQVETPTHERFLRAFGNPDISDYDLYELQAEILSLPIIQTALQAMETQFTRAKNLLAEAQLPTSVTADLNHLIKIIEGRQA